MLQHQEFEICLFVLDKPFVNVVFLALLFFFELVIEVLKPIAVVLRIIVDNAFRNKARRGVEILTVLAIQKLLDCLLDSFGFGVMAPSNEKA